MTIQVDNCDVAVIGGGIIGSSTAYFLKTLAPSLSVCIVEPELTNEVPSMRGRIGGRRRCVSDFRLVVCRR